jgi:hypothetical protein
MPREGRKTSGRAHSSRILIIGARNFSGGWMLVFGVFLELGFWFLVFASLRRFLLADTMEGTQAPDQLGGVDADYAAVREKFLEGA